MCGCGCNNFRNMQGILANNDSVNLASQPANQSLSLNNNSNSNNCCNCSTLSANNSEANNCCSCSAMGGNNSESNNCGCYNSPRCGTNLSNDNWCALLQNYIGRRCSCEFQLANNLVKRSGILNNVGTNFLVLASSNNCSNILLCDTSNLVFVKIE